MRGRPVQPGLFIMKKCRTCSVTKDVGDFSPHGVKKDGSRKYKADCKSCYREKRNKEFHDRLNEIIGPISCRACGYDRCFGAIEFHHIDPSAKTDCIKRMTHKPTETLTDELKKCVMVCANCHREIHARKLKVDDSWRCIE